jgi:hypothetical protein
MTSTLPLIKPQFLTAAALAYSVFSQPTNSGQKISDDDEDVFDAIPQIDVPAFKHEAYIKTLETPKKKRTVLPVLTPATSDSISSSPASVSPRPTKARVSAATMRNIQSRRRVRSAMEQYKLTKSIQEPKSCTVTQDSPLAVEKQPSTMPPSDIHCQPIRFKVKTSNSDTVIRFQCEPCYEIIKRNIEDRLRVTAFIIKFKDDDGDWCVLSDDDDLQDAIDAAANDVMVRLVVEEESRGLWPTIALKFGW